MSDDHTPPPDDAARTTPAVAAALAQADAWHRVLTTTISALTAAEAEMRLTRPDLFWILAADVRAQVANYGAWCQRVNAAAFSAAADGIRPSLSDADAAVRADAMRALAIIDAALAQAPRSPGGDA